MEESNYSVHFTKFAMNDLDDIYLYISKELFAESAAEALLNRLENSIMQLKEFPKLGSRLTDQYLRMKGYRRIIIDSYIIFYIVNEQKKRVIIMRILYGKRKYEDLL